MVRELAEGLWWWTSRHPEWPGEDAGWGPDVSSYALSDEGGATTLFDPLAPPEELLASADRKPTVVLTCSWHTRGAAALAEAGAEVFAPDRLDDLPDARTYGAGDVLPGDAHAYA